MSEIGKRVGDVVFCVCGPKGSLCCTILSLWGSIMLFLLGAFYYVEAAVLLEDFIDKVNATAGTGPIAEITYYRSVDITSAYQTAAYSCFGAGGIYIFFLLLSGSFLVINIWRAKVKAN